MFKLTLTIPFRYDFTEAICAHCFAFHHIHILVGIDSFAARSARSEFIYRWVEALFPLLSFSLQALC
jgi:hypothetical protein